MKSPTVHPLARSAAPTALDWEGVEPETTTAPHPADDLGLSPEDRVALGLSRPTVVGSAHPAQAPDAKAALSDALARGGAYGKTAPRAPR